MAPSRGEEVANSVSHGLGLLASLVGVPLLLVTAAGRGTGAVVGASVFGAALLVLYGSSTLYHALPRGRAKRALRFLDHAAIFLLIAGTYTPFTLTVLRGAWGWSLLGVVWGLALAGTALKAVGWLRQPALSTGLYLTMGWLAVVAIRPLGDRLPVLGFLWLLAGGLLYTAGLPFFAARRLRYAHFLWHLFVLAGTTCHYLAVLRYAA
ncbi:MAG: PAQR family membrane homeostasis protein TrhA [Thermoanaerobaculia bacterium]